MKAPRLENVAPMSRNHLQFVCGGTLWWGEQVNNHTHYGTHQGCTSLGAGRAIPVGITLNMREIVVRTCES